LEELLAAGLGRISISCDGIGANHEAQRGVPGAWKKNEAALDSLRSLRERRYPHLEIEVAMVLSKQTIGDLAAILDLCAEYRAVLHLQFLDNVQFFTTPVDLQRYLLDASDVDRVIDEVHRHIARSRAMDPLVTHQGVEYIRRYLKRVEPERDMPPVSCGVGYAMCYVDSLGNVYPGCFAMAPIGNVRREPLASIVGSARYRTVAKDMFQMNCPRCPNGYAWGVFTNPRSLVREAGDRLARRFG
jgi:MoaA/NifB/PqqE/SkfB family radical SAM enzyme